MEQEEELESLAYIYTEDEWIVVSKSPVHIQIRVQSSPESNSSPIKALLDLQWGANYPNEKPEIQIISVDIPADEKEKLKNSLLNTCDDCMGMAMTYVLSSTLSTLLSELHINLLNKVKASPIENIEEKEEVSTNTKSPSSDIKSKAQKRREQNSWEKVGEKPRGWNWVDVMSHLRKTANSDLIVCYFILFF